eukprot:scaffold3871_cov212-Pinguiococcus_pyrenoidosus.AAC.1
MDQGDGREARLLHALLAPELSTRDPDLLLGHLDGPQALRRLLRVLVDRHSSRAPVQRVSRGRDPRRLGLLPLLVVLVVRDDAVDPEEEVVRGDEHLRLGVQQRSRNDVDRPRVRPHAAPVQINADVQPLLRRHFSAFGAATEDPVHQRLRLAVQAVVPLQVVGVAQVRGHMVLQQLAQRFVRDAEEPEAQLDQLEAVHLPSIAQQHQGLHHGTPQLAVQQRPVALQQRRQLARQLLGLRGIAGRHMAQEDDQLGEALRFTMRLQQEQLQLGLEMPVLAPKLVHVGLRLALHEVLQLRQSSLQLHIASKRHCAAACSVASDGGTSYR